VLDPTCQGFEVETFVKLQALKAKLKIAEVPSFESERIYGRSNLRAVSDGLRVLRTIIRERFVAARSIPTSEPHRLSAFSRRGILNPPASASSADSRIS
jgi:hypothetical protein